jgi:universal stress protein A
MAEPFEKVMLTLDGSGFSRQAAPQAAAIAQRFNSTLILYSVLHNPHSAAATLPLLSSDVETLEAGINRRLQAEADRLDTELRKLVEELGVPAANVDVVVEAHSNAAEAIARYAAANEVDLVVMCTHVRSGLERGLRGSVAETVLHHAPCPVMLVRAKEH